MTDLAAFLLDRIAGDEAAARAAMKSARWEAARLLWETENPTRDWHRVPESTAEKWAKAAERILADLVGVGYWDPARVLAECRAKREIVQALGDCDDGVIWASTERYRAEDALMALGAVYASHPDYREEWRP